MWTAGHGPERTKTFHGKALHSSKSVWEAPVPEGGNALTDCSTYRRQYGMCLSLPSRSCHMHACDDTYNVMSSMFQLDDAAAECAMVAKERQGNRLQDREHGGRDGTVERVATACCRNICKFPKFISTCRGY